jgi:Rrf2 family protein
VLSSTADYALRAILFLAGDPRGGTRRADDIADAIAAPRNYLAKTLNALAKAGIVSSARGPQGGFALACDPAGLTIARVVDSFGEPRPQPRCMLGTAPCDPAHPCTAHERWTAITRERRDAFTTTTIADLLTSV